MRPSLIFRVTLRVLKPLMFIIVAMIFLRGHHLPGGGFIAGLIGAITLILMSFAHDPATVRKTLKVEPLTLVAFGLMTAYLSSLLPSLMGHEYMKGVWTTQEIPVIGKMGTPVVFDFGVMMIVIGMTAQILLLLKEKKT